MDDTLWRHRSIYRDHHFTCRRGTPFLFLFALCALTACVSNGARRDARLAWDGKAVFPRSQVCDQTYALTDDLIWQEMQNPDTSVSTRKVLNNQIVKLIAPELIRGNPKEKCWKASYENHQNLPRLSADPIQAPGYDLFYAEFDDQGERTDVAHNGVDFDHSQVALIESRLKSLVQEEGSPEVGGGLNIVLFTHGWHGNSDAVNNYSIWFKAILEQIAELERTSRRAVCWSSKQQLKIGVESIDLQHRLTNTRTSYACSSNDSVDAFKERRTVGIEIAWRGDSEVVPFLTWANFWDRKGAAQTAARGAVNDLMARLHKFYLSHSCHDGRPHELQLPCDNVHLLTVGHSFGALIDYHSLSDDLATGVLSDGRGRAYGFGDMTVLLNPAFEGEREITLIEATIYHASYPNTVVAERSEELQQMGRWPSAAQMPTLVTLQSEGDWATHYAFPAARFVTSAFENTTGANEYSRSIEASGWVQYYRTHRLITGPANGKDDCVFPAERLNWYCPFDLQNEVNVVHPLTLAEAALHEWPAFARLWTVQVQKSIMKDHDDISNPVIVRFIGLLFRAAYEQEELTGAHPIPNTQ